MLWRRSGLVARSVEFPSRWLWIVVFLLGFGVPSAGAGEGPLRFPLLEDDSAESQADNLGEGDADDGLLADIAHRLRIGGEIRIRGEARRPVDYRVPGTLGRPASDSASDDDDLVLLRTRLHFEVEVKEGIDVFLEFQDSRVFGDEASVTSDEEGLDLHQGYFEIRDILAPGLSIRAGRQEFLYGNQRLISPLDWANTGRAFDAVKIRYEPTASTWVDGFTSWIREGTTSDEDRIFSGVYGSTSGLSPIVLDAYVLNRRFSDGTFVGEDGRAGDLVDTTPGFRAEAKGAGFDGTFEAMGQFGEFARDDTVAYALAVTAGYTLSVPGSPRIGIEYDRGSGDRDPDDGRHETFDPLFPFGHAYQGYLDIFSWKNGQDLKGSVSVRPARGWFVETAVHALWLTERRDAWYNAAGQPIRRDTTGAAGREVGFEIDLHAKYKFGESVSLWFGYAHFFPGQYVRRTGRAIDADWVFFQAAVTF